MMHEYRFGALVCAKDDLVQSSKVAGKSLDNYIHAYIYANTTYLLKYNSIPGIVYILILGTHSYYQILSTLICT